jgi:voltage-gated potassium channel Kch
LSRPEREVAVTNVVDRVLERYLRDPVSVRRAMAVIVAATAAVVVGSGVLMRIIDRREYRSVWTGMWWAMQTVTTVGYGDVTPRNPNGRIVATIVMLVGIAFLAIVTASITSTFVEIAGRARRQSEDRQEQQLEVQLGAIQEELVATRTRLERIEELLGGGGDHAAGR